MTKTNDDEFDWDYFLKPLTSGSFYDEKGVLNTHHQVSKSKPNSCLSDIISKSLLSQQSAIQKSKRQACSKLSQKISEKLMPDSDSDTKFVGRSSSSPLLTSSAKSGPIKRNKTVPNVGVGDGEKNESIRVIHDEVDAKVKLESEEIISSPAVSPIHKTFIQNSTPNENHDVLPDVNGSNYKNEEMSLTPVTKGDMQHICLNYSLTEYDSKEEAVEQVNLPVNNKTNNVENIKEFDEVDAKMQAPPDSKYQLKTPVRASSSLVRNMNNIKIEPPGEDVGQDLVDLDDSSGCNTFLSLTPKKSKLNILIRKNLDALSDQENEEIDDFDFIPVLKQKHNMVLAEFKSNAISINEFVSPPPVSRLLQRSSNSATTLNLSSGTESDISMADTHILSLSGNDLNFSADSLTQLRQRNVSGNENNDSDIANISLKRKASDSPGDTSAVKKQRAGQEEFRNVGVLYKTLDGVSKIRSHLQNPATKWTVQDLKNYFTKEFVEVLDPLMPDNDDKILDDVEEKSLQRYIIDTSHLIFPPEYHFTEAAPKFSQFGHWKELKEAEVRVFLDALFRKLCLKAKINMKLEEPFIGDGLPRARVDYAFYKDGICIGIMEAKRPSTLDKKAVPQFLLELLNLQSRYGSDLLSFFGILVDAYRFVFVRLQGKKFKLEGTKTKRQQIYIHTVDCWNDLYDVAEVILHMMEDHIRGMYDCI